MVDIKQYENNRKSFTEGIKEVSFGGGPMDNLGNLNSQVLSDRKVGIYLKKCYSKISDNIIA